MPPPDFAGGELLFGITSGLVGLDPLGLLAGS